MSYCIAFSVDGATDVTRRYVQEAKFRLQRRLCSEESLGLMMKQIRDLRRADMTEGQRFKLQEEDASEETELQFYTQWELVKDVEGVNQTVASASSPPSSSSAPTAQGQPRDGSKIDKGKRIAVRSMRGSSRRVLKHNVSF